MYADQREKEKERAHNSWQQHAVHYARHEYALLADSVASTHTSNQSILRYQQAYLLGYLQHSKLAHHAGITRKQGNVGKKQPHHSKSRAYLMGCLQHSKLTHHASNQVILKHRGVTGAYAGASHRNRPNPTHPIQRTQSNTQKPAPPFFRPKASLDHQDGSLAFFTLNKAKKQKKPSLPRFTPPEKDFSDHTPTRLILC